MATETAEVIEGEVRELALVERRPTGIAATGVLALAALTDSEFDIRLAALRKGATRVAQIQKALMEKDVDYGVIPGTPKPTLLKPGAEKLCLAYSLAADFAPDRSLGDGETAPAISYLTRCDLHLGDLDGPIVAVGYGAANSWEKRYRYRQGERSCPNCEKVGTIIKGKAEYGGGWLCWPKKGGCNAKWPDGDASIERQEVGQIDNPDPWDLDVTLAKMAEKRAHVDATLRATAASSLFTQDMEDVPPSEPEAPSSGIQAKPPTHEATADGGLIGIAAVGEAPADYELRMETDGENETEALSFKLMDGRKGFRVVARGKLAIALSMVKSGVIGQRVICWGQMGTASFAKGTKDITYAILELTKIQAPEFTLPADPSTAAQEAPTEPVSAREAAAEMDAPVGESAAAQPVAVDTQQRRDGEPIQGAPGPSDSGSAPAATGINSTSPSTADAAVATSAEPTAEPSAPRSKEKANGTCANASPYGDGAACGLPKDHSGLHRELEADGKVVGSWPTT